MSDDVLREVDNALKWHNVQKLWQRARGRIIAGVALIAMALAGYLLWLQQQQEAHKAQSDVLLKAALWLQQGTQDGDNHAMVALESLKASGSHEQIRALMLSAIYKDRDRNDDAAALLDAAISQKQGSKLLVEFACLLHPHYLPELSACITDPEFKAMQAELEAVNLFKQGKIALGAQRLPLNAANIMQQRRLDDVRSYVNSSLNLTTGDAQDTE